MLQCEQSPELALDIQGLHKTYDGGVQALKGISLSVRQGDFFALLGPNGAGKSTTIGAVSSLVNKSAGQISVCGYNLENEPDRAKRMIGLVPQEFNFNQFETVLQIVTHQAGYYGVPRAVALQRAEKYLSQLSLWEKRHERARNLSGGMKRRLMIARALIHQPQLLILDEPTAGVDIEIRRSMWDFLRQINREGVTIILTTHYLEEAEMLCRNIAIIDQGCIVENTTIKELLSRLNIETFVLDLDVAPGAAAPQLEGMSYRQPDSQTLEVDLEKGQSLNSVFRQLDSQQVTVRSMRNKANRLEELFVRLVEDNKQAAQQQAGQKREENSA